MPVLPQRSRPGLDRLSFSITIQVFGKLFGRAVPLLRIFVQALQADGLEIACDPRDQLRRRHRVGVDDQADRLDHRLPLQGGTTGQNVVKDRPQGVDVCRRPDVLCASQGLLGSHVARRAHDVAGLRLVIVRFQTLRQPEVGDLGRTVSGQQHVGRLEVAVHDPGFVGGVNGPGQGRHQQCGRDARLRRARQLILEVASFEQLE